MQHDLTFANNYCKQKAARSGSSFYYSFMFLPAVQKQAIIAVYAFCREIDDIADVCHDRDVAEKKLLWWQSELGNIMLNRSQHPVGIALAHAVQQFELPKVLFEEMLQGMLMDIQYQGYQTFADLKLYCHCVASTVGLVAAKIFGYQDANTENYARQLGIAFQLTNIIRDVHEDLRLGRCYLPELELEQVGLSCEDIRAGVKTELYQTFMQGQIQRAREFYRAAFAALPEKDRAAQRPGLVMAAIYQKLLDKIERHNFGKAERISLTPIHKLYLAWSSNRAENKRQLKISNA